MSFDALRREMPAWAIAVILAGVLAVGFLAWRSFFGGGNPAGPPKEVQPGMYDLRKEIQKSRSRPATSTRSPGF